ANDDNFRANFLSLKNSIYSSYEFYGIIERNNSGIYEYSLGRGLYNFSGININIPHAIDGYIHSHFEGLIPNFFI
ncbi:hypothetical protein, partial [Anditalea andensis]|uniref:hypothetical protein n=1 Tax=Anditalea andensis TaxID=1048983 RepID=UPI000557119F